MTVDELALLVPVGGDGDWRAVEAELGPGLPAEFKGLLGRYGVGQFDDVALAVARDWLLTSENCYGHQIRVAFPPEHDNEARTVIPDAARGRGCQVLNTTIARGKPVWADG